MRILYHPQTHTLYVSESTIRAGKLAFIVDSVNKINQMSDFLPGLEIAFGELPGGISMPTQDNTNVYNPEKVDEIVDWIRDASQELREAEEEPKSNEIKPKTPKTPNVVKVKGNE